MPFTGKKQINNIRKDGMLLMDRNETYFDNSQKYIELGYNIAYYRKHAKLTQEQLAEKLNISRQHLGAIEAPNIVRVISMDLLFNIATVLQIEPSKLLEFRNK